MSKTANSNILMPLVAKTVIGVVVLMIIWLLVSILPMIDDIELPLEFTLSELLTASILTILVVLLINFGERAEKVILKVYQVSIFGTILKYGLYFISVIIIYTSFLDIFPPYMDEYDWIYNLIFLILAVIILAMIGFTLFTRSDELIYYFQQRKASQNSNMITQSRAVEADALGLNCNNCGASVGEEDAFCTNCGRKLEKNETDLESAGENSQVEDEENGHHDDHEEGVCKHCGTSLVEGAAFCIHCGNKVE